MYCLKTEQERYRYYLTVSRRWRREYRRIVTEDDIDYIDDYTRK